MIFLLGFSIGAFVTLFGVALTGLAMLVAPASRSVEPGEPWPDASNRRTAA
jgi:hypothetical protein